MKHTRLLSALLLASLLTTGVLAMFASAADLSVFALEEGEVFSTFTDVEETQWYYFPVAYCQSAGLLSGNTETTFAPEGTLTVAEAVTVAVRVYEAYYRLPPQDSAQPGEMWYLTYVRRAERYGLLPEEHTEYDSAVSRSYAARLFCRVLPEKELPEINEIHTIPGVLAWDTCAEAVYQLYRAGVLAGRDTVGTFDPENTLTRAELASILVSLVNPDYRHSFSLTFDGLNAFTQMPGTEEVTYTDVAANDWYYEAVMTQTQLGMMNGTGDGQFSPEEPLTVQQTLALAVRLHEKYFDLAPTDYADAPEVAAAYGICTDSFPNYDAPINRANAANILHAAIPAFEFYSIREVGDIPDVEPARDSSFYPAVHSLYCAGILSGMDGYGTFGKYASFTRAQAAKILTAITVTASRSDTPLTACVSQQKTYGVSGSGAHPLLAYQLGCGENVLFLTYLVHGKGEICAATGVDDGDALYALGQETLELLRENYGLIAENNWTVYLIPCVNPDGYFDGTEPYGTGRMTAYSYNNDGELIPRGIDINRSFPHNWTPFSSTYANGEYYNASSCYVTVNGQTTLRSVESQALLEFVTWHRGTGANVIIDTHGFTNQVLSSKMGSYVHRAFMKEFPGHAQTYLTNATGYFTSYFANLSRYVPGTSNYDTHLFEFAEREIAVNDGVASVKPLYGQKYQSVLLDILEHYGQ